MGVDFSNKKGENGVAVVDIIAWRGWCEHDIKSE